MAMPVIPESRRYSVAEVLAYPPDGNRYEVVAGELLVTPSPAWRHQLLVSRLMAHLLKYLEPLGLADALITSPADITWDKIPGMRKTWFSPICSWCGAPVRSEPGGTSRASTWP